MSIKTINLFDGISENFPYYSGGLKNYLDEVWQTRPLFLRDDVNENEIRSKEQRFFRFSTGTIKPRNYIGFVQYGDVRINVYPRVFYNRPANIGGNPKIAINHVLKWLSYGSRIHFPFSELDHSLIDQEDWLEALVFLFSNYTLDVLSSSPHFSYQEVTEEMAFVRGRIAMQEYINHNLVKGKHHLVHCTYEPFVYDNRFNRIVKYTCRLLQRVTSNNNNRLLLDDLLFLLDEVSDIYCTTDDCAKVTVNRLYPQIGIITNMCGAFLSNQAYADGLMNNQNLCILLPMEIIYEQYVAGFIQEHLKDLNPRSQVSDEYLANTGKDFTIPVFQMRHDILLDNKRIIDTKYKFRFTANDLKGGVSQGDLYQMVSYCYKRRIPKAILLYPKHFDKSSENAAYHFKIDDFEVDALSVDVTEENFANFEVCQKLKFQAVLK
jgi:5-methylcytosine-specific restriction enzyme subunit McrC